MLWSGAAGLPRLAYACFGAPIVAPLGGEVVFVRGDRRDVGIGETNRAVLAGNAIIIRAADAYVLLAHLQAGSVQVKVGDRVERGQRIARCGNSGNTSEPHLHIQAQDSAEEPGGSGPRPRTFPIRFDQGARERAGRLQQAPFFVRRNDLVRPAAP